MIQTKWVREPKQLFHIYSFKENIIKKHIEDDELTNVPLLTNSENT